MTLATTSANGNGQAAGPGGEVRHILIAEDVQADARALGRLLKESGFPAAIEYTQTIDRTIDRCRHECPDLILLDLGLPGCEGTEALEAVRTVCPRIATVIVTGSEDEDLMIRTATLGAHAYIRKDRLNLPRLLFAIYSALTADARAERDRDLAIGSERVQGFMRSIDERLDHLEKLREADQRDHQVLIDRLKRLEEGRRKP